VVCALLKKSRALLKKPRALLKKSCALLKNSPPVKTGDDGRVRVFADFIKGNSNKQKKKFLMGSESKCPFKKIPNGKNSLKNALVHSA